VDFFKGALQTVRAQRRQNTVWLSKLLQASSCYPGAGLQNRRRIGQLRRESICASVAAPTVVPVVSLTAMRRFAAILLIVLLGGVPALSALTSASASTDVPSCCRKDGAHMCAMRHGHAKPEEGKAKLFAYCPFAAKGTPAVPSQRAGNVVAASSVSSPILAGGVAAKPQRFALVSTSFLANAKRGPPRFSSRLS